MFVNRPSPPIAIICMQDVPSWSYNRPKWGSWFIKSQGCGLEALAYAPELHVEDPPTLIISFLPSSPSSILPWSRDSGQMT